MEYAERLEYIIREIGLPQAEIARLLGMSGQNFSGVKRGLHELRTNKLLKMSELFNVNADWLVSGQGDPFRPGGMTLPAEAIPDRYKPRLITHAEIHHDVDPGKGWIPIYDIAASATSKVEMTTERHQRPASYAKIPGFENCDFIIPVWGHSMYPTFENGCYVVCKNVDKRHVTYGEAYFVDYYDYRVVKRVLKSKLRGHYLLASDNESLDKDGNRIYGTDDVPVDDIRGISIIKGVYKRLNH